MHLQSDSVQLYKGPLIFFFKAHKGQAGVDLPAKPTSKGGEKRKNELQNETSALYRVFARAGAACSSQAHYCQFR